MGPLRAFIAIETPSDIRQAVAEATADLRRAIGALVRWVPVQNMHLTLKFLGDVAPSNVDALSQVLRTEGELVPGFDMHLGGVGVFPNLKRPRVIYIGIQAPAALETLQRRIESAAGRLGYESEERGFSPHLTIGRVKQGLTAAEQQLIRRTLEDVTIDSPGTARVDSVHLYKSDLQPGGSVYTRLYSAALKKQ
jgi:RNA 2',3'-cyclic 3'-phosphodiesterase